MLRVKTEPALLVSSLPPSLSLGICTIYCFLSLPWGLQHSKQFTKVWLKHIPFPLFLTFFCLTCHFSLPFFHYFTPAFLNLSFLKLIFEEWYRREQGNNRPVNLTSVPCKLGDSIIEAKITKHTMNEPR